MSRCSAATSTPSSGATTRSPATCSPCSRTFSVTHAGTSPTSGMQIMIEGLALASFGFLHAITPDPLLKTILRYVMSDEARHVAFGVLSLGRGLRGHERRGDSRTARSSRSRPACACGTARSTRTSGSGSASILAPSCAGSSRTSTPRCTAACCSPRSSPTSRSSGLLDAGDGWLRQKYTEMGIIQYEDWVDTIRGVRLLRRHRHGRLNGALPEGGAKRSVPASPDSSHRNPRRRVPAGDLLAPSASSPHGSGSTATPLRSVLRSWSGSGWSNDARDPVPRPRLSGDRNARPYQVPGRQPGHRPHRPGDGRAGHGCGRVTLQGSSTWSLTGGTDDSS